MVSRIRRDSLGLSGELLFVQAFFSILWSAVAITLYLKSPGNILSLDAAHGVVSLKLVAIYAHAVVIFSYPISLLVLAKLAARKTHESSSFRTWLDVQRFWTTEQGCAAIQEIARASLALENPLFLKVCSH